MINLQCSGNSFEESKAQLRMMFLSDDSHVKVNTGHWQSVKGTPHSQTRELQHVTLEMQVPATSGAWAAYIQPNLPWAEDHFQERVSGEPLNPGEQYKNWPWYKGGVEDHKQPGLFSHTYMERFWPSRTPEGERRHGIRYKLGDLENLVHLLQREPHTRQAYLPIWFPEDIYAASVDHQRVPCTLGYHFMIRNSRMHCFYPMRSVDFVRYLQDDIYMAGRLIQWIINAMGGPFKYEVIPGKLVLFASSLHIFEGDVPKMIREQDEYVKTIS